MAYQIFEKAAERRDADTNIFIRLECEEPNEVSNCTPLGVEINNQLGYSSPIIRVAFKDGRGDLFNHMKVNTDAVFTLAFGRNLSESFELKLKISKVEYNNGALGRPHDMYFTITFVTENWYSTIAKRHNRGWSKTKINSIVEELFSDSGFSVESELITETAEERESTIQPYWSNWKMINWLKGKSNPADGAGHFEAGVTLDGIAFFLSTDAIYKRKENDVKNRDVPVLRMIAPAEDKNQAESDLNVNQGVPTYFVGFKGTEFYADGIKNGGGGYQAMWYDWNTGEYNNESVTFDGLDTIQLSEFSSIRQAHNDVGKKHFGGRDTNTVNEVENMVQEEAYSMFSFDVMTNGSGFIDITDIVEVIIDNTSLGSKIPLNEMYSGFYMVSGYRHIFSFSKGVSFQSTLTLSRHGIDFFDYDGFDDLVTSSVGRF